MAKKATRTKRKVVDRKPPPEGEKTKPQQPRRSVLGIITNPHGFNAPAPGTFTTYRQMRGNPTIALARIAATAPIRASQYALEADDDVTDDTTKFMQSQVDAWWPKFIKDALYALDYGFQAFEKVWERDQKQRWIYAKIKPLVPEKTNIAVVKKTGAFNGLVQDNTTLEVERSFLYTYDMEGTDYYGRARHENVREVWSNWIDLNNKIGQYATKGAGIIPMIRYPEGRSQDAAGKEVDNFEIATTVLANLGKGNGVAMPNNLADWAEDSLRAGIDVSQLAAWLIDFLEAKSGHGQEFVEMLRHYESLMARGWLVPERAIIEGQFGTKAEAKEHGELGVAIAGLLLDDIVRSVNKWLINPLLVYNFGPQSKDTVRMRRKDLSPEAKAFFAKIIEGVLTSPANIDLLLTLVDLDAVFDELALPKQTEVIDTQAVAEQQRAEDMRREQDGAVNSAGLPSRVAAGLSSIYSDMREGVFPL